MKALLALIILSICCFVCCHASESSVILAQYGKVIAEPATVRVICPVGYRITHERVHVCRKHENKWTDTTISGVRG